MSLGRRIWRLARSLGRNVGESLIGRWRPERHPLDRAEEEARAEIEAHAQRPEPGRLIFPPSPSETLPRASDLSSSIGETQATIRPEPTPAVPTPQRGASDPTLTVHYLVLGLPVGANILEVERRYRRLKEECQLEACGDDPVAQARARQKEARLDEAYHALRQALVRERRL